MPCNYPIQAYRLSNGAVVFDTKKGNDVIGYLKIPCGQCTGCRIERARQWAVRCVHEAYMHERNCFITLTYNDEHIPDNGELDYSEFQRFMKRLRKRIKVKIKFFMCGEYGEKNGRPHFHACIFGFDFDDRIYLKTSPAGSKVYTSKTLESLWTDKDGNPIGFVTVGDVNFNTASYVARYVLKKKYGKGMDYDLEVIDIETGEVSQKNPQFTRMSLREGIGASFYRKYKEDIFPHDYVVIEGKKMKPPRYYTKKLAEEDGFIYDDVIYNRELKAKEHSEDNTEKRLLDKEEVLKSQLKFFKREL